MRRLAAAVLSLALLVPLAPRPVRGQFVVHDPIAFVQMLVEYAQMLADYYQQYRILAGEYRQIEELLAQYELMEQDLEALEHLAGDNPSRFLEGLRRVFFDLRGVVYASNEVLARYDELYTPEVTYDLVDSESERLAATMTTFRTLLAGAQEHARASEDAAGSVAGALAQVKAAEGNLEALQALGGVLSAVATETTRVSEVQALVANAVVVREAHELALREEARLTLLDWMNRGYVFRAGPPAQVFSPVPAAFREGR